MHIGEPVRTIIVKPERLPIPERDPALPERREEPLQKPEKVPHHV